MGKLLGIYLNDHLAGSTVGRELARRAASNNRGGELGKFLERLAQEIDEDRDALLSLMSRLDIGEDRIKQAVGWSMEKVGRLKLNGQLVGYSPLSLLTELEGLSLGVAGKLALWHSLERASSADPRIAKADLPLLIARAESQRDELERHRLDAARQALTGG